MKQSIFHIKKMDCPSEENLIRLKLERHCTIAKLDFRIVDRTLTVFHDEDEQELLRSLAALALDTTMVSTTEIMEPIVQEYQAQAKLLWQVLIINVVFFLLEMIFGLVSKSMGLVSDSLDMLSDSFVYGLSLFAVGAAISRKKRIAAFSGYIQLLLASVGILEVFRRTFFETTMPDYKSMIIVSLFALGANWLSLYLLQKSKSEDAHMKASMIFTSNDMLINAGVILAGILVSLFSSPYPDLIIGSIVFVLVTKGAFRILKLSK